MFFSRHRVSSFGQHRPKTTLNPPSSTSFSRCSFTPQPPSSKPHPLPSLHITPSHLSSLDPSDVVRCVVSKDQITPLTEAKQLPYKHLYHFDCITLMAQTPHLMFAMQVSVGRGGGKRRWRHYDEDQERDYCQANGRRFLRVEDHAQPHCLPLGV